MTMDEHWEQEIGLTLVSATSPITSRAGDCPLQIEHAGSFKEYEPNNHETRVSLIGMAEASITKNEDSFVVGGIIVPEKRDSQNESSCCNSDDDLMGGIDPSNLNLNLDHITPSLFIPQDDHQTPPVREEEMEISSTSFRPDEVVTGNAACNLLPPKLNEESFGIHPQPPLAHAVPPASYLGFVPYSVYNTQQNPSVMQYPYSSTPFHAVIPYGYTQSLEMTPPHVQQLYMKRLFHHPDFISPVIGAQHTAHGISPHHPSPIGTFSSMRPPGTPITGENVSSSSKENVFQHHERDSVFNDEKSCINERLTSDSAYISSEVIKEDPELKPFTYPHTEEMGCLEYNYGIRGETNSIKDSINVLGNLKTDWCKSKFRDLEASIKERDVDRTFSQRNNSPDDYYYRAKTFDASNYFTPLDCNYTGDKVTESEGVDPLEQGNDTQRIRPEMYRNCKSLFQNAPTENNVRMQSANVERMRLKSSNNMDLLSCSECDYSSFNKSNFRNHLFIHSEERLFACPHCTYKGKQSAGLRAHLKVHSVEKPFKCSVCNYNCKRKQNLIQHFRIHSKYRPFLCSYCSYRSTTKQSLQKHMLKHFGETSKKQKDKNNNIKYNKNSTAIFGAKEGIPTSNSIVNVNKGDDSTKHLDYLNEQSYEKEDKIVTSTQIQVTTTSEDSPVADCSISNCSREKTESENVFKNNYEYNCLLCDYKAAKAEHLQLHISSHKLNDMKCTFCDFQSDSSFLLINHIKMHNSPINLSSDSGPCLNEGSKVGNVVAEASNDLIKPSLQCPYCNYDAQTVAYLKLHITSHGNEDFWIFKRHPSNLVSERRYTAQGLNEDCSQSTVVDTNSSKTDLQQKEKIVVQKDGKKLKEEIGYGKSSVYKNKKTNVNVKTTTTIHTNTMNSDHHTDKNVKRGRACASTKTKHSKPIIYPNLNFSAKKTVFKSLRSLKKQKRKIIPVKNRRKIQNRIKLASNIITNKLNVQNNCSVSSSQSQRESTLGSFQIKESKVGLWEEFREPTIEKAESLSKCYDKDADKIYRLQNVGVDTKINLDGTSDVVLKRDTTSENEDSLLVDSTESIPEPQSSKENLSPESNISSINACEETTNRRSVNYAPPQCSGPRFELNTDLPYSSSIKRPNTKSCNSLKEPAEGSVYRPSSVRRWLKENMYNNYSGFRTDFVSLHESRDVSPKHFEYLDCQLIHSKDLKNFHHSSCSPSKSTNSSNRQNYSATTDVKCEVNKYCSQKGIDLGREKANVSKIDCPMSYPKNEDQPDSNQSILKNFLLRGNYKLNTECYSALQEMNLDSSEPLINTETFKETKINSKSCCWENESGSYCSDLNESGAKVGPSSIAKPTMSPPSYHSGQPSSESHYSRLPSELKVKMTFNGPSEYYKNEMFKCSTCDSSFKRKSSLVNHKRSHAKDEFKCSKCPFTFRYKKAMEDHEKTHSNTKTFKCSECDFSSLRKCSLMSHFRIHKRKFKCMYCSFKCSLIKKMEMHYLKHKQAIPIAGTDPSARFIENHSNSSELVSAKENHCEAGPDSTQNGKQDEISVDNEPFPSPVTSSLPLKPHECEICNVVLEGALELRNHLYNDHSLESK